MTYEESAALMQDIVFRNRIKVACLKFADYIMAEPQTTPGHNTRTRWAGETFRSPDLAAQTAQPPTVMDAAVQAAGAAITDAALQSSVEATVNKMM